MLNLLHLSMVAQSLTNGISSDIRVGFYGVEIFENDFLIYSGSATEAVGIKIRQKGGATLRSRGWSPYAMRLDPEQHAWIALVMDWRHAA